MSELVKKYNTSIPTDGRANLRGIDPEPIGFDRDFSPSRDLANNESELRRGRHGQLLTTKYTDTVERS
jgi:hypothetical protein